MRITKNLVVYNVEFSHVQRIQTRENFSMNLSSIRINLPKNDYVAFCHLVHNTKFIILNQICSVVSQISIGET